ncbi:MAG: hypothetical protein IPO14_12315 [Saprospiraceae bacterium]|jgi:hypothetical protein|nr:hypothetical protein [Saprospiraceae bacterium]
MKDKQLEKIKAKIEKYKKALKADKKHWGGEYHDGQGIRYLIPEQYIKLKDYKSGQIYLNWFQKNFPNDSGYPNFLFEWTLILFYCGKLSEAKKKVYHTFFSNTYLFDKFLEKEPLRLEKYEGSNYALESLADSFKYKSTDSEFIEFASWLTNILSSQEFLNKREEYIQIERKLLTEPVGKVRSELVERSYSIWFANENLDKEDV